MQKNQITTSVWVSCLVFCGIRSMRTEIAWAHSVSQRVGFYEDNASLERRRLNLNASLDLPMAQRWPVSDLTFGLALIRDQDRLGKLQDSPLAKRSGGETEGTAPYEGTHRTNDQWSVSASQTWAKLTETRQVYQVAEDGVSSRQTKGVGLSKWVFSESLKLSLDVSQTDSIQPEIKILDFDSREVGEPPNGLSRMTVFSIRHLATPTTLVDYTLQNTATKGRPQGETYAVRIRQFLVPKAHPKSQEGAVPASQTSPSDPFGLDQLSKNSPEDFKVSGPAKFAVEFALARALNKGTIGTDTTYGEVDALSWETYGSMELPSSLTARLGYRYYREEEVTRVLKEEKLFGSDLISLGISYLFDRPSVAQSSSFSGQLLLSRYQTNQGLLGRSFELGLSALL